MTGAARRVLRLDVPRGERVVELLPSLAAALSGEGPALLPVDPGDPRADAITAALGADMPVAGRTFAGTTSPGTTSLGMTTAAGRPLADWEDDPADPTALVMPTSGSTGTPKGVLLSAGQLAASAAATEARLGGPGSWLLALPAEHIAGMQVLLRAARAGTDLVALDGERPFTAADFARRAAALPGPRRYVSLVPTQLQRVLADPEATAVTADLFDAVLIGGSAIDPRLLAAARAAGIRAVTTYGMTETCGGCVYDGVPLDGVSVLTAESGDLSITGPMVARGYRGRRPFSHRTFVTSDFGEIGKDGRVTVLGRSDDVIVTGGVKVPPAAVEAAIRALPGVADVLVVGLPSTEWGAEVAALIVPASSGLQQTAPAPDGPRWDALALRQALDTLPATHRPRRVITVPAIPLLPSGKPDRTQGAALAAADNAAALAASDAPATAVDTIG